MNPTEAASYSNRAMAYLRQKNYARTIEDANKCIELDPEYVKAYHRRGKAYLATKKYELAIRDFQFILEKDPDNQDINASLREARQELQIKEDKASASEAKVEEISSSTPAPPAKPATKGFKRVSIEEDESSEEEQANAGSNEDKENTPQQSSKPLIQEVSSSEKENWLNKKNQNYDQFDLSAKPAETKPSQPESEKKMTPEEIRK